MDHSAPAATFVPPHQLGGSPYRRSHVPTCVWDWPVAFIDRSSALAAGQVRHHTRPVGG